MSYIDHFLDAHKPLCKPKFVCIEEDWELVGKVFPEPGFRSFFCGHIISKLAHELRQQHISTYFDRESRPEFASLTGLLSHIDFAGKTANPDDRRGTRGACESGEERAGEPAGDAQPTSGGSEGKHEEGEQARHGAAGFVIEALRKDDISN